MRPRSRGIGAPTSAPCPVRSYRVCAIPGAGPPNRKATYRFDGVSGSIARGSFGVAIRAATIPLLASLQEAPPSELLQTRSTAV